MGGRRSKKGAFDLSLGFIIIVVFAVVLLTLGITWLRGVVTGVTGLTDDLTQQASTKLQETFQQSSQNFALWPPSWSLERGKGIKMSAGIKNNAPDSQNHMFVINVVPTAVSSNILRNYPGCTSIETCSITVEGQNMLLKDFMVSWVTWSKAPFVVERTQTGYSYITISIPQAAPSGTYMFGAVACKTDGTGMTSADQCTPTTLNWGGSMQPIEINVK